jgi:hypothetical protein
VVRSCVALYGKTGGWRVKKVTAWFEKVLLLYFCRVKWAVGHALRLTSLRDEWRRMTYPTAHLTGAWMRKADIKELKLT